jgi:hypothetical protein
VIAAHLIHPAPRRWLAHDWLHYSKGLGADNNAAESTSSGKSSSSTTTTTRLTTNTTSSHHQQENEFRRLPNSHNAKALYKEEV